MHNLRVLLLAPRSKRVTEHRGQYAAGLIEDTRLLTASGFRFLTERETELHDSGEFEPMETDRATPIDRIPSTILAFLEKSHA